MSDQVKVEGSDCESASDTEPLSIFGRSNEGLHHFSINKAAIESIQFIQPEIESGSVWIAT